MWSSNDYGSFSTSGDFGGGYMASTAASASSKKLSSQGSIVPCTCAEIMSATQDGDKFVSPMGLEFSQVTVVGIVRTVNESATRVEYEIDDYTGAYLPVKMFVEDQDNASTNVITRPFRELTYVRVHGHVRNFQGVRHVIAFRVLMVTDMNEVTTHIMEIIYTRMLYTKMKLEEANSGGNKSAFTVGAHNTSSSVSNGLTVLQNQILAIVRTFVGERGIPVSQLTEKLRGVPERQIREDLDFLSAEGHVYSTVDDDHFRATET